MSVTLQTRTIGLQLLVSAPDVTTADCATEPACQSSCR